MKKKSETLPVNPETNYESKINKLRLVHYISFEMNKPHSAKALLTLILERCLELTGAKTECNAYKRKRKSA